MKWQPTAILAVVAVGIGAYIYFVERPKPQIAADDKTVYAWNMSDLQAEPLSRVEVKVGTASAVYLKVPPKATPAPAKGATASVTPDPLATPPQPSWHKEDKKDLPLLYQWDSSWSDFKRMQVDRVVEEKASGDDKVYEFSKPEVEVKIGTDKEPEKYSLVVGKKSITGTGHYMKIGKGNKVYLVANYKVDNWKKLVTEPPVATPTPPPPPTPAPPPPPAPATGSATGSATTPAATK